MQTLFFSTHEDRVALARRRYFEEGELPSGVVSEAVFQSWSRCLRLHQNPGRPVEYQPVSVSRTQLAMQRNHHLLASWQSEVGSIEAALGATNCAAMLTDPSGVIVGAACVGRNHEQIIPAATRLGVNLSEEAVGTTAPGIVTRTGRQASVLGGEHFFERAQTMYCAAAPIRGINGQVAGVLDISSESAPFVFDAAAVVGLFAATLENRLLLAQAREHLVLRVQLAPSLLDSPAAGLLGFDAGGLLAWCNAAAARLVGLGSQAPQGVAVPVERLLGCGLGALAARREDAFALDLPSGLRLFARALWSGDVLERRWFSVPVPAPADDAPPAAADAGRTACAPRSYRQASGAAIQSALEASGGNISAAARTLKVSRGLIYRYLRAAATQG